LECGRVCETDAFPDSLVAPKKVSKRKNPTGVTKRIQSTNFSVSGHGEKRNNQAKYKSLAPRKIYQIIIIKIKDI